MASYFSPSWFWNTLLMLSNQDSQSRQTASFRPIFGHLLQSHFVINILVRSHNNIQFIFKSIQKLWRNIYIYKMYSLKKVVQSSLDSSKGFLISLVPVSWSAKFDRHSLESRDWCQFLPVYPKGVQEICL